MDKLCTQAVTQDLQTYLQVALPVPLHGLFDYRLPPSLMDPSRDWRGCRVEVQFGARKLIGIVLNTTQQPTYDVKKIRPIIAMLDTQPVVDSNGLKLAQWCSDYYFYPIGECIAAMTPKALRQGKPLQRYQSVEWRLTSLGEVTPLAEIHKKSSIQAKVISQLHDFTTMSSSLLQTLDIKSTTIEALEKKGLITQRPLDQQKLSSTTSLLTGVAPTLTKEQTCALYSIQQNIGVHVLFGVTGSGKTEVYMRLIEQVLHSAQQVLILVPEIGLTPQTLARFNKRFNVTIAVLHSQQSEGERLRHWCQAASGEAQLVIGTRSAVFTPIPNLGLIIIDEEHDQSYKQQDGMRYSARDLALLRARWHTISVVLGSATPSLETLFNVKHKGFKLHQIKARATGVAMPSLSLVDLSREQVINGLADSTISKIKNTLQQGFQVLIFLNRRGFAPAVVCNDCGWTAQCARCDAKLTLHRQIKSLKCHHCEYQTPVMTACPMCRSAHLNPHGKGTQRLEETLKEQFSADVIRVDRDTMPNQKAFKQCLARIDSGEPLILLGTQMLSKGHDFLGVHLVVMIDVDGGLFSSDFRAEEKTSQLLTQVAGRAGRGDVIGQVLVQTYQPNHSVFQHWLQHDYPATADYLLAQRQACGLPPYAYHVLIRAEATQAHKCRDFLFAVRQILLDGLTQSGASEQVQVLGPVNAAMERRAGMHRFHLLLQGVKRSDLHRLLRLSSSQLATTPLASTVRWGIEIDPQEF